MDILEKINNTLNESMANQLNNNVWGAMVKMKKFLAAQSGGFDSKGNFAEKRMEKLKQMGDDYLDLVEEIMERNNIE